MVEANTNFAAYLPCRIAVVEDAQNKAWLFMMNLDIILQSASINKDLKQGVVKVRDILMDIMKAGAAGDL